MKLWWRLLPIRCFSYGLHWGAALFWVCYGVLVAVFVLLFFLSSIGYALVGKGMVFTSLVKSITTKLTKATEPPLSEMSNEEIAKLVTQRSFFLDMALRFAALRGLPVTILVEKRENPSGSYRTEALPLLRVKVECEGKTYDWPKPKLKVGT